MHAHRYGAMLSRVQAEHLAPRQWVSNVMTLSQFMQALTTWRSSKGQGTVITDFSSVA